jgi:LCP family protein required for cell wall assembly
VVLVGGGLLYANWRFWQFGKVELDKEVLARPGVTRPVGLPIPTVPITEPPSSSTLAPGVTTTEAPPTTEEPEVTIPGATTVPAPEVPAEQAVFAIDTSGVQALGGADAINTLLIGTDGRENVSAEQARTFGKGTVSGSRSDTIMILRTDPATAQAALLSIPRDTWVRVPGSRGYNRINATYRGDATLLVRTIQENFGIPIHHVVEVDFVGFQDLVGVVGGVNLCFPHNTRDQVSGLRQPAGCHQVDPRQSIAYVRSRHWEEERTPGVWTLDPSSDLGRVTRQQEFIRNTLLTAVDRGLSNPLTLNAVVAQAVEAVKLDPTFGLTGLIELANQFRSYDPNSLVTYTVKGRQVRIDGKQVMQVDPAANRTVIGLFGRV